MKKYHIITIGCQMNKADSERIAGYLDSLGYQRATNYLSCDITILTTCGIRKSAEERVYGFAGAIKKKNPQTLLILTGCLSERKDVYKKISDKIDIWLPINDLPKLGELLKESKKIIENDYLNIAPMHSSPYSAYLPIGNGCNNFCSYCVVPYARGRERYRLASKIISEAKDLIKKGFKEIILIAQNVNSYQSYLGKKKINFSALLKEIDQVEGDFRVFFFTSHPKDMSEELIDFLTKAKNFCPHLHLPVQAGNDEILKKMNRNYNSEHYLDLIKKIKQKIPNISITTDIIVGFPEESRSQFKDTKNLMKKVKYDMAYIARYSPRPGTAAYELNDNISSKEKQKREDELMEILRKTALDNNKKYLNKNIRVLIEGINKKGELFGKSDNFKNVKIICKNHKEKSALLGSFAEVKIKQVADFGLSGELIKKPQALVILGPTSSGKTGLAVKLAIKYQGEIISADSRQVYKYMDVGTGKDLIEYQYQEKLKNNKIINKTVPYHLIDVVHPRNKYDIVKYQKQAQKAITDILERGKLPIIVGGSGLYLQAVVDNYDFGKTKIDPVFRKESQQKSLEELQKDIKKINPDFFISLNESEQKNQRRLIRYLEILQAEKNYQAKKNKQNEIDFTIIGLTWPKEVLWARIHKRLLERLEKEDMVGEVKNLREIHKISWSRLESFGLEYKHISLYLQGKVDYKTMQENLYIASRQFAKRQMTWFRRWEKQGREISWISSFEEIKKFF